MRLRRLTLSAILAALTVVFLYVGAVVEVMDLTLAAMAALLVTFSRMEMGVKYAFMLYFAAGILSFLLLPSKLPAILYLVMTGIYPILKFRLERFRPLLSWVCKLAYFNAALTLVIWLTEFVLGLPDTGFSFELPVYLLGNVTYVLFDVALSMLIRSYQLTWRRRLRVQRFFGHVRGGI